MMSTIYRSRDFSLTQSAVDHINRIREDYLRAFPEDPPVLAGISTGYPLDAGPQRTQVIIGFWRRSEVSSEAWAEEDIVDVAGLKMVFAVVKAYRSAFKETAIDYSPDRLFFLRPLAS